MSNPFDITSQISNMLIGFCKAAFKSLETVLDKMIISPDQAFSSFMTDFMMYLTSIAGSIALAIFLFKIVQVITQQGNGQGGSVSPHIVRVIQSAALVMILPWIETFMTANIAVNFMSLITGLGTNNIDNFINDLTPDNLERILKVMAAVPTATDAGLLIVALFSLFILVLVFVLFYQSCVRLADLAYLKMLSPFAATAYVSMDNDYVAVWWREMLSVTFQLPLQMICFYSALTLLFSSNVTFVKFMGSIGFFVLMVKTPQLLRNFMYSTGTGRFTMSVIGGTTRMAARRYLFPRGRS